eukprot:2127047-Prymnesium_polylepis.2
MRNADAGMRACMDACRSGSPGGSATASTATRCLIVSRPCGSLAAMAAALRAANLNSFIGHVALTTPR